MAIDIGLEHLGIDEEADQALGFHPVAVGRRYADTDIGLATVAIQQGLERSQQQHEQRHAFALGDGLEPGEQLALQRHVHSSATMALDSGTRIVQGQFQNRLRATQPIQPIPQLALLLASLHPTALPQRVVGVLDRQLRQLQLAPLGAGGIQLHQLVDHHLHRPAIGDDMVLDQHQDMLILGQAQQAHAQQRPLLQVEGTGDLCFHQALQPCFVGIDHQDLDGHLRPDDLQGVIAILLQASTQAFMARHQGIEAALQRCQIQRSIQTQRPRHMIGRTLGLQLPEKPLPLLGIRESQRFILLALENRGDLKQVDALLFEQYRQRFLFLRRKRTHRLD